ncbi:PKD domain-containing protein [Candidatus Gracilibacteria bacterium]|nr:PKD domain-containing protein [Candidatus Gracilibacteria bacterium]
MDENQNKNQPLTLGDGNAPQGGGVPPTSGPIPTPSPSEGIPPSPVPPNTESPTGKDKVGTSPEAPKPVQGTGGIVMPTPAPFVPPQKNSAVPSGTSAPKKEEKNEDEKETLEFQPSRPDISATTDSKKTPPPKGNTDFNITSHRGKGAGAILKWFFIFALLLVAVFYGTLLWALLGGSVSNPLFEAIGIQESELQSTLILLTNALFGFLALFFLIGTLIKFFQWLMLGRNAANRREYGVKSIIFLGIFLVVGALWVALFWLIVNTNAAEKQIKADVILTNPTEVIALDAPVTVEFNIAKELFGKIDKSLIRQINWDFDGDGSIDASGEKVVHRFLGKGEHNGRFPVILNVIYFSPSVQEERTFASSREVIIANESVRANLEATPESGTVPLKVKFSAASSEDPDGKVVLYEWDLDGKKGYEIAGENQKEIEKTFSRVGEFQVGLRVTGTNSDTAVSEKTIVVTESTENLQAKISSSKGFEGLIPFSVTLDGQQSFSQFGNIVKYIWHVQGETEPFEGQTLQRTFRSPGTYNVTLTVENDLGERAQKKEIIEALSQPPEAKVMIRTNPPFNANGILEGNVPFEVQFDSSSSTIHNAVEWRWDFDGNGTIDDYGRTPKYVFRSPGTYNVKLIIVDSLGKTHEQVQRIVVGRAGIQAHISANPIAGTVPLTVDFDGSGSTADKGDIVNYIWEFPGRGPIHSGAQLSYEFQSVGTFPVKLRVVTSEGEEGEKTMLINVRAHPLKAQFSAVPSEGEALTMHFDPSSSTGTILDYFWDFGDGTTIHEPSPSHTYENEGVYEVSLKVTDPNGIVSTTIKNVTVGEVDENEEPQ